MTERAKFTRTTYGTDETSLGKPNEKCYYDDEKNNKEKLEK